MSIRSIFTSPPDMASSKPWHQAYRYSMLVFILFLTLPSTYPFDPYSTSIVALMLLFSHLAYWFKWPTTVTVILRVLVWIWIVFAFFYMFYLSHVLYPLSS